MGLFSTPLEEAELEVKRILNVIRQKTGTIETLTRAMEKSKIEPEKADARERIRVLTEEVEKLTGMLESWNHQVRELSQKAA
jgi:chromosome segregation ATPase